VRLTIERLRILVLAAAVLLLAATVAFLAIGKWKNPLKSSDLPKKLGIGIETDSNGVTFSHALGGHSQFKIHASRVQQLKEGNALLHNVQIELYGEDGNLVDRIEGNEFEYNQKDGDAVASGPVEITLMRPGVAPAIAPKATPNQVQPGKDTPLGTAARAAAAGQVHVKTSKLHFNWNTGLATTDEHVDFLTTQGTGSSTGAIYDSKGGHLVLERDVALHTQRGNQPVEVRAIHAEFTHANMICDLRTATIAYRDGQAQADQTRIEFRENGSATYLDATGNLLVTTVRGSRLQAPRGHIEFNEHNQPQRGHLEGGVTLDSVAPGRKAHGTAPTANLEFTPQGDLRHVKLDGGVDLASDEEGHTAGAHPEPVHSHRTWRSPVADVDFRTAAKGSVEPTAVVGVGGVVVQSRTERGKAAPALGKLAADQVNGEFAADSVLRQMTGSGHASVEQTLASGTHQTATGDRLDAHFAPTDPGSSNNVQVDTATLDGRVVLLQQQPAKAGAQPDAPLHAYAGHAVYAADGQWLHLTVHPRVEDGSLLLAADKIDVSQDTGDAFAHGNVKATWTQMPPQTATQTPKSTPPSTGGLAPTPQEPAHVIANEGQLHQASGNTDSIATFRGHARLWQQANSVAAPTIVLEKNRQTLDAHSTDRAEPVRVILLSQNPKPDAKPNSNAPAVIRVRGGDLHYSGLDRTALMQSGQLGPVVAETPTASSQSDQVDLKLAAAGKSPADSTGMGQVERMIARGHVTLNSQGRRGWGEQLVYTAASSEYLLTGTAAAPPRIADPARGTVSGAALIFRSRDDSVRIEGGGHPTTTQTTAPR
jgi:lipopolysaccharide export system protein LptA